MKIRLFLLMTMVLSGLSASLAQANSNTNHEVADHKSLVSRFQQDDSEAPGLRMVALGDLELENRVAPMDEVIYPEGITATITKDADVFDIPAILGQQTKIGAVTAGTQTLVDAISVDGQWLRLISEFETPIGYVASVWVDATAITIANSAEVNQLPQIGSNSFGPLQNFGFTTQGCGDVPCGLGEGGMLFLQAPEDYETNFVANNAPIVITGSVLMTLVKNNTQMEITVLSGVAVIGTSPQKMVVPPGYTSHITVISLNGYYSVASNGKWDTPSVLSPTQVNDLTYYESFPSTIINQPVNVPQCSPNSSAETCDLVYDYEHDAKMVANLCQSVIFSQDFAVCQKSG